MVFSRIKEILAHAAVRLLLSYYFRHPRSKARGKSAS